MIDTIVLVLKQNMFNITNHDYFSPSTEGLFNSSGYYRMGGRSNMVCKQNPTASELKAGNYKPRLTVTKRMNRQHEFEITMKIEFSIPKLLFGNNFEELEDTDFEKVIQILKLKLRDMGVLIFEQLIINAPVSAIHYSKNIPLTDYTTPYTYINMLSKANINQRLDLNQTDFRNEGHSLKYRANSFEIAFYDKLKDLNRARTSEKRAEERENEMQLNLFEEKPVKEPFEVLRIEIRLNKKYKLIQVLKSIGIIEQPTFKTLFRKKVAQKVLLYYLDEIEDGYPKLLLYKSNNPKDFLSHFILQNPKAGLSKAMQMLGMRVLLDEIGIREFREITKKYGSSNWYNFNKELKRLNYPQGTNAFLTLRTAISEFKSLKLVDFQKIEVNNRTIN